MLRKILGPSLSLILFAAAVWLLHNETLFSDEWRFSRWKINPLMRNWS